MLDRPGDSAGNVQVRRYDLARLADLVGVRDISGVYSRPAGADRAAQRVC